MQPARDRSDTRAQSELGPHLTGQGRRQKCEWRKQINLNSPVLFSCKDGSLQRELHASKGVRKKSK